MNGVTNLDTCRAALVPRVGLAVLAPLRRHSNVQVVEIGDQAWVMWESAMPSVVNALLTVEGARFYHKAGSEWRMLNRSLPDFKVPATTESMALDRSVLPAPFEPVVLPSFHGTRIPITLTGCTRPRPTSALRCRREMLEDWCNRATTAEIEGVTGAWSGSLAWLRGRLPVLPTAERFWGQRVLVPLGFRADPDWPESALRQAAIVDDDEILVLTHDGPEAIGLTAFQSLSRAKIRQWIRASAG